MSNPKVYHQTVEEEVSHLCLGHPTTPSKIFDAHTLPKTNIAPENGWLEYYFPFGMASFQGLY